MDADYYNTIPGDIRKDDYEGIGNGYHYEVEGECGSPRHMGRLYQLMRREIERKEYGCATMTMQWIQMMRPLYLTNAEAAEVILALSSNFDGGEDRLSRINWSEVIYVD